MRPRAAFHIFPRLDVKRFGIHDDELFALDLLKRERILVTHGGGFHWPAPDHFRLVCLPRLEELDLACRRIAHFLLGYHQG